MVVVLLLLLLLLPLGLVVHRIIPTRLVQQRLALLLSMLNLLVLLREIARCAAARTEAVFAAVACQAVFGADVAAVHQGQDPGKSDAD